jgi:predicted metal-dependent phosphoesterase TrpH
MKEGYYLFADLHIHSIFSDSTRSPENIAQTAKNRNVSLLSVCDHGTIASYERLAAACGQYGVSYVLGIEMGAVLDGQDYHMLVYSFDPGNREMIDFIRRENEKSDRECEAMVVKMCHDYPQLSRPDYLTYNYPKESGGWKYIHYAVERNIFNTYEEAGAVIFPTYYQAGEEACSVEDFCNIVKQANGVPVLAHPGNKSPEQFASVLPDMQERGVEGIECFYPSHSKMTTEFLLNYCHKNNLRITGGSDCHGEYDKSEGFTIGFLKTPLDMLDLRGIV